MIKVNERFYIYATSNCYTLQEKTKVQDETSKNYGQEIYKDLGYYTTIESCLQGILKVTTREYIGKETINTLNELQKEIQDFKNYLKGLNLDNI